MNGLIGDICRCCMSNENSNEMVSIFSEIQVTENKILLSDMLMACTAINISNEDPLPLRLCYSCVTQLTASYDFKRQCEKTEERLRNICNEKCIENGDKIISVRQKNSAIGDIEVSSQRKRKKIQYNNEILKVSKILDVYEVETVDDEIKNLEIETDENYFDKQENIIIDVNYKCKICDQSFLSNDHLNQHVVEFHFDLTCSYCEKLFTNKISLRSHLKIHTTIHACTLCKKTFKSSHGLWYHMKRHYNIKAFQCTLCDKKFTIKQSLDKHFETLHTDDKKYLCPKCGKAYSTHDALSYHLKTHTGQRPYLCIHCGKTFKQACHLKTHMWIHNGIKPFKCDICGNCYTTGHQLKKHHIAHYKKSKNVKNS